MTAPSAELGEDDLLGSPGRPTGHPVKLSHYPLSRYRVIRRRPCDHCGHSVCREVLRWSPLTAPAGGTPHDPLPGKAMTALSTSASILVESQRSQAGHRAEAIMTTVRVYSTRGEAGCVWVASGLRMVTRSAAFCTPPHAKYLRF
jgi:hypothetical protein